MNLNDLLNVELHNENLQMNNEAWEETSCGKCMQPTERNRLSNKARYDVLSIPGYVIKKRNPTHGVPDMDHLCGSACTTKHMICWGKPASTKVVATKPFWKNGTMMTNAASLCQILGDLTIWRKSIGSSFLRGHMARKKSERKILENFFECRRYSRTIESAQWR